MIYNYGSEINNNIQIRHKLFNIRCFGTVPWYTGNSDVHRDLRIPGIASGIKRIFAKMKRDSINVETIRRLENSSESVL